MTIHIQSTDKYGVVISERREFDEVTLTSFGRNRQDATLHVDVDLRKIVDGYAYHDLPSAVTLEYDLESVKGLHKLMGEFIEFMENLQGE